MLRFLYCGICGTDGGVLKMPERVDEGSGA